MITIDEVYTSDLYPSQVFFFFLEMWDEQWWMDELRLNAQATAEMLTRGDDTLQ